jgi:hypothetical protein
LTTAAALQRVAAPSVNVIVPEHVLGVTEAVSVVACPRRLGFTEDVNDTFEVTAAILAVIWFDAVRGGTVLSVAVIV